MKYISYLILSVIIIFNLWLYYPETKVLADPNDDVFQFSLVQRTDWVWHNYGCPFSLSCLPNLVDHNVPTWAEGYPLPFYYSHIPQIAIVSSYNIFLKPLITNYQLPITLYNYYSWTKYLLLCLFPLPVFFALRIAGFSPFLAVLGAFFASHFSTDGLYGIDPPSFLWRGFGLTSQLYAMFFLPLALSYTFRSLINASVKTNSSKTSERSMNFAVPSTSRGTWTGWSKLNCLSRVFWTGRKIYTERTIPDAFLASLFLTLTTAGHLGIGIIGYISTIPFLFLDLNFTNIRHRFKRLFFILASSFLILAYWIIPVLIYTNYHMVSFWDPLWKFNSYGWYETIRQFLAGEIFDWQRWPIISGLVIIGFFTLLTNTGLFPFTLLFVLWFLFYFGRTTWGPLIDLIPGMKDFHQHRFIVGVQIAGIFLIPAGIQYLTGLIRKSIDTAVAIILEIKNQNAKTQSKMQKESIYNTESVFLIQNIIFYILLIAFISTISYLTIQQTINYASLNSKWIGEANIAYKYDEKNFQNLLSYMDTLPKGRVYAGRPGNWGKEFRLGSTQMYMLFGVNNRDMSQFLPETWSPLSENEQNFDERVAEDFDLLNIRYTVAPPPAKTPDNRFSPSLSKDKQFGPFQLYIAPTSGWFEVVTSPMFVKTDKTNFINVVQLWHRSYPRRWNMFPLISVDPNPDIPAGMQRIIKMVDEVNYIDLNQQPTTNNQQLKNIFSDFPFVFPESTVSGQIKNERIEKQAYSATVDVPQNCKYCFVMFKMSYHPDWKLKIDGEDSPKYAVFPFYLAAQVTPGTHTVEFTYEPNRLKVFLIVMELAVGIIFIFRRQLRKLIK